MPDVLTVSQVIEVINAAFESLGPLTVEGEVSDFRIVHNKWVTFSLKDVESTLPCFLTVWQLKTQIEDGMLIKAVGKAALRQKGFFSFVVQTLTPSGEGALKRAFELLQQKLAAEGLFAPERKRALPRFPEHIALITSREAAAYSDFIKVLRERQGGLQISFIHTQVQGEDAPRQIIEALQLANTELQNLDAIVLVRGGGSLEDLQAFNDESVIRAVAASRAPTIVGVGHERDITLAELAADIRASTPSNAAELIVRSRLELLTHLSAQQEYLISRMYEALTSRGVRVSRAVHVLQNRIASTRAQVVRHIDSLLRTKQRFMQDIGRLKDQLWMSEDRLSSKYVSSVKEISRRLIDMKRLVESLSPKGVLGRGYSITRTKSGRILKHVQDIHKGDSIATTLSDGSVTSIVKS